MAVQSSRVLFECRTNLARLFGVKNPNHLSFALNTTMALNQAIFGFVREGDHVICTAVEHNSVRRPIEYLCKTKNVTVTYVQADSSGKIAIDDVARAITPSTTLIVANHSSNLLGAIAPLEALADLSKSRGCKLLVDAAQTAGTISIQVEQLGIDMLAFPGHKSLLGPQGTGGLYVSPELELEPLLHGGTGSLSEAIEQPHIRPDRFEAGTQNTVGIAGLNEGVKYILNRGIDDIHQHEWQLTQRLMQGLMGIEGVAILGPALGENKTGIVSFNVGEADPAEVAFILDQSFDIAVRAGYHCTPLAHEAVGTFGRGAVRASVGYMTTNDEVDHLVEAIQHIAAHVK